MDELPYKTWQCRTCGYIYDEPAGDPDEGLAPGTRWADVPAAEPHRSSAPPTLSPERPERKEAAA